MRYLITTLLVVVLGAVMYSLYSFMYLELNPFKWEEDVRKSISFGWFSLSMLIVIVRSMIKKDKTDPYGRKYI
jgi:hypothetical protein